MSSVCNFKHKKSESWKEKQDTSVIPKPVEFKGIE